jgi:hypothetical protein
MHKQEITMHNQETQQGHSSAAIYSAGGPSPDLKSWKHLKKEGTRRTTLS